mmetsp:Transcript_48343/g.135048  ORF Transcript_48343/g.135048 Transcript_48343/m.135048 type:complete len:290 (+) Transcript_48343:431-1300(+)
MMCSAKSCCNGPFDTLPTKSLNLITSWSPTPVTTLNFNTPLSGPSAILASYFAFCSRILIPLTSRPKSGETMSRQSGKPPMSKGGETRGLPTQSLNFPLTLSMRHSTRGTCLPSTSLTITMRLSGNGMAKPGGGMIFSDFAFGGKLGSSSSSMIFGMSDAGAVVVRIPRRLLMRPVPAASSMSSCPWSKERSRCGSAMSVSSLEGKTFFGELSVVASATRPGVTGPAFLGSLPASIPSIFIISRVSKSMSLMSFVIWPRDRSSFWTREVRAWISLFVMDARWVACPASE